MALRCADAFLAQLFWPTVLTRPVGPPTPTLSLLGLSKHKPTYKLKVTYPAHFDPEDRGNIDHIHTLELPKS